MHIFSCLTAKDDCSVKYCCLCKSKCTIIPTVSTGKDVEWSKFDSSTVALYAEKKMKICFRQNIRLCSMTIIWIMTTYEDQKNDNLKLMLRWLLHGQVDTISVKQSPLWSGVHKVDNRLGHQQGLWLLIVVACVVGIYFLRCDLKLASVFWNVILDAYHLCSKNVTYDAHVEDLIGYTGCKISNSVWNTSASLWLTLDECHFILCINL